MEKILEIIVPKAVNILKSKYIPAVTHMRICNKKKKKNIFVKYFIKYFMKKYKKKKKFKSPKRNYISTAEDKIFYR